MQQINLTLKELIKMGQEDEILLIADVMKITKLSTTTIWRGIIDGDFPKNDLTIGKSRRAWLRSTINNYINELIEKQKAANAKS